MRSKKRFVAVMALVLMGVALLSVPASARMGRAARGTRGVGRGMGPAFTEEQQEQIEKIREGYADERAELTNRLKVIMVEAHDVDGDSAPDYRAIERNIEEVAEIRVKLAKLRLQIHQEIRPLLDDDQKVLFDRGLAMKLHSAGGPGHPGAMGRRSGMARSGAMGCGAMGRGGAAGRCGVTGGPGMRVMRVMPGQRGTMGGPGMMGGAGAMCGPGEMTPCCPFADDAGEDQL